MGARTSDPSQGVAWKGRQLQAGAPPDSRVLWGDGSRASCFNPQCSRAQVAAKEAAALSGPAVLKRGAVGCVEKRWGV